MPRKMDLNIETIDAFIARYPKDVQAKLEEIRKAVKEVAPEAKEKISYGIPTFTLNGNLVHFSAYEKHIGFYPGSGPIKEFEAQLKDYETSKGTVRFPTGKPLPIDLIKDMVRSAVSRNLGKKNH